MVRRRKDKNLAQIQTKIAGKLAQIQTKLKGRSAQIQRKTRGSGRFDRIGKFIYEDGNSVPADFHIFASLRKEIPKFLIR